MSLCCYRVQTSTKTTAFNSNRCSTNTNTNTNTNTKKENKNQSRLMKKMMMMEKNDVDILQKSAVLFIENGKKNSVVSVPSTTTTNNNNNNNNKSSSSLSSSSSSSVSVWFFAALAVAFASVEVFLFYTQKNKNEGEEVIKKKTKTREDSYYGEGVTFTFSTSSSSSSSDVEKKTTTSQNNIIPINIVALPVFIKKPKEEEEEEKQKRDQKHAIIFTEDKVAEIKEAHKEWAESYADRLHPWDREQDNTPYHAIVPSCSSSIKKNDSEQKAKEKHMREVARRLRLNYFKAVSSKRYVPTTKEQNELDEQVKKRLESNAPIFDTGSNTLFKGEHKKDSVAMYGTAMSKMLLEKFPQSTIVGEGTFSDVFLTSNNNLSNNNESTLNFFTQTDSVLKCSAPFPGRDAFDNMQGDGYGFGKIETTILASLPKHPAIVEIQAAFLECDRNESYVLMNDVGENAHEARKKGRLTPRECRALAKRVLHGLKHLHDHNVIHRDIKSGNILIGKKSGTDRKATIIDFGVAYNSQTACEHGDELLEYDAAIGTTGYQAPELLLGKYDDDDDDNDNLATKVPINLYKKVDIFAFGVSMYFLCCGKELFSTSDAGETKSKQKALFLSSSALNHHHHDAKILRAMLKYPDDFKISNSQKKNLRHIYEIEVVQQKHSFTLSEKIIEDFNGRQPVAFAKLIGRCLNVDPSKRPSASEALLCAKAFEDIANDEDIEAFEKCDSMTTITRTTYDNKSISSSHSSSK
jgi:serine/threonine protein kinase